jgi:hypothetical protein
MAFALHLALVQTSISPPFEAIGAGGQSMELSHAARSKSDSAGSAQG